MITIFDLETEKLDSEEGVGGWGGVKSGKAGLSVVCTITDGEVAFWDKANLGDFIKHLEDSDLVVSFNGKGFDLPVLAAFIGRPIYLREHYDIFMEAGGTHGSGGLDAICRRTLGRGKDGHGLAAPALWQTGRIAELYTYCLRDVERTRDLFEFIQEHGYIVAPDGSHRSMRRVNESSQAESWV